MPDKHPWPAQYPWLIALFSNGTYFGVASLVAPGTVPVLQWHLLWSSIPGCPRDCTNCSSPCDEQECG